MEKVKKAFDTKGFNIPIIKILHLIVIIFLLVLQSCSQEEARRTAKQIKCVPDTDTLRRRVITVRTYFHHISDLNFRDQEYKIEMWLYLTSKDSISDSLADQVEIKDAKDSKISFIAQRHENGKKLDSFYRNKCDGLVRDTCYRRILKIRCTMIKKWDVDGYPFDPDSLDVVLYSVRPSNRLLLRHVPGAYTYADINGSKWNIENDWHCKSGSVTVNPELFQDIFDNHKQYAALHYNIPIYRDSRWALFFKLFVGMYVAFLVAFIAMFIHPQEVEPRFGLPVGGLFAAIGNKYIIEGLLPLSTQFNLIDELHSTAIIFILIIIAYSAYLLFLTKRKKQYEITFFWGRLRMDVEQFDKRITFLLFLVYLVINLCFVCLGWQ